MVVNGYPLAANGYLTAIYFERGRVLISNDLETGINSSKNLN